MKNINIIVENKRATVVGSPVIVCGNSDYTVTFQLDNEWSLTGPKTARFVYVQDGYVQHTDVPFSGNTVAVPVLANVTSVKVGLFEGDLCTTTPARIACDASIRCGSGAPQDPDPDVYDQIMALFSDLAERGGFGATEEQMQLVEQNRQGIAALEAGTKKAGDANKLGGQLPSYYATADGLNSIQTTSRATLSTAGWYRVAELNSNRWWFSLFEIGIYKDNAAGGASSSKIRFTATGGADLGRFETVSSTNSNNVTRIRITTDNTKCYLEVYYALSMRSGVGFVLNNAYSPIVEQAWKAITPTLTQETVSGVTVTTTYDIPANASPVTDLDLVRFSGTEIVNTSILEKALTLADGIYEYRLGGGNYTGGDLPTNGFSYGHATIRVKNSSSSYTGTTVTLWGYFSNNEIKRIAENFRTSSGTWSGWETFATTADLAKYLALNGSAKQTVKAPISIPFALNNSNSADIECFTEYCVNNTPIGYIGIRSEIPIFMDTKGTMRGLLHTGNIASYALPLDGGGEVKKAGATPLKLTNTSGASCYTPHYGKDGFLGALGFNGADKPIMLKSDANTMVDLLHTGNSAKVHIGTGAPSDTTSVWFDTSGI